MELKIEMKTYWGAKEPQYIIEEDFSDPVAFIHIRSIDPEKTKEIVISEEGIDDLIDVLQLIKNRWK